VLSFITGQITYCYDKFTDETLSEHNPSTYLDLIDRVSFFFGSYGLFILLNIELTYNILDEGNFRVKFFLVQSPLILFKIQEITFDILLSLDKFPCDEHLSSRAFSKLYLACGIMVQCVLYGVFTTIVYIRNPRVTMGQGDMKKINDMITIHDFN